MQKQSWETRDCGTTALYSDVVLPAASYCEKVDVNSADCHSYIHPFGKACEPLFESKTDWDIFHALAQKMSEVAKQKGLKPFHDDAFDWNRDFTQLLVTNRPLPFLCADCFATVP